jgi:hypothetical protein
MKPIGRPVSCRPRCSRPPAWARLAGAFLFGLRAALAVGISAGLMLALPTTAIAQPAAGLFELRNLSTQTLRFDSFDPARRTWQPQSLAPNASLRLVWAGAGVGKVRIPAEGRGYVEFEIRGGMRYDFTWNPATRLWEMHATPRI